jgi:hypothetical protein
MLRRVFCFLRIAISVAVSGLSVPTNTPTKLARASKFNSSGSSARLSEASGVNSNG